MLRPKKRPKLPAKGSIAFVSNSKSERFVAGRNVRESHVPFKGRLGRSRLGRVLIIQSQLISDLTKAGSRDGKGDETASWFDFPAGTKEQFPDIWGKPIEISDRRFRGLSGTKLWLLVSGQQSYRNWGIEESTVMYLSVAW